MWRRILVRYLAYVVAANLAWEITQSPLYTLWRNGSPGEIAFAIVHCTAGDVLIALAVLMLGLALVGRSDWPTSRYWRVAAVATVLGLAYTFYSEWLNTTVRQSWSYAETMLLVPPLGTGLAPLLQWILLPPLGFWWARRACVDDDDPKHLR
jgi:hypothetical protein